MRSRKSPLQSPTTNFTYSPRSCSHHVVKKRRFQGWICALIKLFLTRISFQRIGTIVLLISALICGMWTVRQGNDTVVPTPAAMRNEGSFVRRKKPFPRVVNFIPHQMGSDFSRELNSFDSFTSGTRNTLSRYIRPLGSVKRQNLIASSSDYKESNIDFHDEGLNCQLEADWQRTTYSSCNTIHEFDWTTQSYYTRRQKYTYLTHGYYRDVWSALDEVGQTIVIKPMRFKHDYTFRNFDRMRRDTMTMDRLTGYKHILNIYAACGTTGFFEFASGGDIENQIWDKEGNVRGVLSNLEKLHIATQVAIAVASLHNVDKEGRATIAHTDISPGQFIRVGKLYKLNDFNRARFLRYSHENHRLCPFYVGNNAGKNRSPEEYSYKGESEMVCTGCSALHFTVATDFLIAVSTFVSRSTYTPWATFSLYYYRKSFHSWILRPQRLSRMSWMASVRPCTKICGIAPILSSLP